MDKEFENPLFSDALSALFRDCEAYKPPQIILERIVGALEHPIKLFCWVGDTNAAVGATRPVPGFYASDLLVELMEAVRALDWEIVGILLEQAISPQTAASTAGPPQ
jgi:hypothetical protein